MQTINSIFCFDENYFKNEFSCFEKFRFAQLKSLRNKGFSNINQYRTLGSDFLSRLKLALELKNENVFSSKVVDKQDSDEACKLIIQFKDFKEVECVYIKKDQTVCLSSQVGCALGCKFCSTALLGFKRNLLDYEIIEQFFHLKNQNFSIKKIVFMGMGEPLLNLGAVLSSIKYFCQEINISIRNITISTVGIVKGLQELCKAEYKPKLTFSIHKATAERTNILPSAKFNSLQDIKKCLLSYQKNSNRRITLAWTMLSGVNLTEEDIRALKDFAQGLVYNVNLIYFNRQDDSIFKEPSKKEIKKFITYLKKYNIPYSVRHSKGSNIKAACGQLELKRQQNKKEK